MVCNQRLQLWKYFLVFFMQLSSRSKLRKEACALWQFLFNFARCPASGQLGIAVQRKALAADRQCLKQSLQRLQLTAYTTECVTMCAQNPCAVLFSYGFHKQIIDRLILSIFAAMAVKRTIQRVLKRNPNLNSAESSLLTFFQESLKKLKKLEENIKRKH